MVEPTLVGEQIENYTLERLLGAGGMGVVYLAVDVALHRKTAVKLLPTKMLNDARARARFQREIESSVSIEHPHVVPVYDAGYDGQRFYIVMRYVEGPDLAQLVTQEGPLEEARAMRLVGQISSALDAVHRAGLVHRDVKPHNVLVWAAGEPDEHAMLTDFGIAKALDDTGSITGAGPLGTPPYMAPEVWEGHRATPASDQYSLACLAFELLSGRRPFEAGGFEARQQHLEEPPPALDAVAPGASRSLCDAVARALAKSPGERFPDVRAFVGAARAASESFERAEQIARTVHDSADMDQAVNALRDRYGLRDGTIAEIVDLDHSQVVRRRRRAARQVLTGQRRRP